LQYDLRRHFVYGLSYYNFSFLPKNNAIEKVTAFTGASEIQGNVIWWTYPPGKQGHAKKNKSCFLLVCYQK